MLMSDAYTSQVYSSESSSIKQRKNDMQNVLYYEYFLTNSMDVLNDWSTKVVSLRDNNDFSIAYLRQELSFIMAYLPYRLINTIRLYAFMDQVELALTTHFQDHGFELLHYIDVIYMHKEANNHPSFKEKATEKLIQASFTVTDVMLMLKITQCIKCMTGTPIDCTVSLGSNFLYYKNLLRGLTVEEQRFSLLLDQHPQIYHKNHSPKVLQQLLSKINKEETDEKSKIDLNKNKKDNIKNKFNAYKSKTDVFRRVLQGLSFQRRCQGLHQQYARAQLIIPHLHKAKKYIDYAFYEQMYIQIIDTSMKQQHYLQYLLKINLNMIPIQKRKQGATIERKLMVILKDYMQDRNSTAENREYCALGSTRALESPLYFYQLMSLLCKVEANSKSVFQHGDLQMQRIYLQFGRLMRQISLSFKEKVWLYPSQLIQLRRRGLLREIKNEINTVLYDMMVQFNEQKTHLKLQGRRIVTVTPAQQLSVIIGYSMDVFQKVNFPQIMPTSLQTSILYVSLLPYKMTAATSDEQKKYYRLLLQQCQQYKVYMKFSFYEECIHSKDRELEYNVVRQLPAEWMRKTTQKVLQQRDTHYFEQKLKVSDKLRLVDIVNYLKYYDGFNALETTVNNVNQEQLFTLMEQIYILLSIQYDNIFTLSRDETITFNYLHLCLSLYNCKVKEAPASEIYATLFNNILQPYLRTPISLTTAFRTTYPNFFNKWIYSSHIPAIFRELSSLILDQHPTQDTYKHLRFLLDLIDNQELKETMMSEPMIDSISQFASVLQPNTPPAILVSACKIVIYLLTTFPTLSSIFSIQIILSNDILRNCVFFKQLLSFFSHEDFKHTDHNQFLINYLVEQLPHYMQEVGPRYTQIVMHQYLRHSKENRQLIKFLTYVVDELPPNSHENIFMKWLCKVTLLSVTPLQQQLTEDYSPYSTMLLFKFKQVPPSHQGETSLHAVSFTKLIFLNKEGELDRLGKQIDALKGGYRAILKEVLIKYGSWEDRFFWANKMGMSQLINEQGLVDLILQDYHKESQTQLIKKFLREQNSLKQAALLVLDKIRNSHGEGERVIKVTTDHIRRLIHINNRYPQRRVEEFLLQQIGRERQPCPIKITQYYLSEHLGKGVNCLPPNLCETVLLTPMFSAEFEALEQRVNELFEKLLYLPIRKFEKGLAYAMKDVKEEGEWKTDSQEESKPKEKKKKKKEKEESEDDSEEMSSSETITDNQIQSQQSCVSNDEMEPEFIKYFFEEDKKEVLALYKKLCEERQCLDVEIMGDYEGLRNEVNVGVRDRLNKIVNIMNALPQDFREVLVVKMPKDLYNILRVYKLQFVMDEKHEEKIKKKYEEQPFEDQFTGVNIDYQSSYDQMSQAGSLGHEDGDHPSGDSGSQDSDDDLSYQENKAKEQQDIEQLYQMPSLMPTYSIVLSQIQGKELNSQQITKLLQIALFKLLAPQIRQFYLQILDSDLGSIFLQSILTALRMEEESIAQCIQESQGKEVGLRYISLQNAVHNVIYLVRRHLQTKPDSEILYRESPWLLPVGEKILLKVNEAVQKNVITILFLYVRVESMQTAICNLTFKKSIRLSKEETKRLLALVWQRQCVTELSVTDIWGSMSEVFKIEYKQINLLKACTEQHGRLLLNKLTDNAIRIKQQMLMETSLEDKFHVVGKLMMGQHKHIDCFYQFVLCTLKGMSIEDQTLNKVLYKHKNDLIHSKELISLIQLAVFSIKKLIQYFHNHIEIKQLNKLVLRLKKVIEVGWFYINEFNKKSYEWKSPKEVEQIFKKYSYGEYVFKDIYQVSNLVMHFFHLQTFCTMKFRSIFMPYFLKNAEIGRQVPLIFKAPMRGKHLNKQSVTLTRQCSFDMCFLQLNKKNINVTFYQEEGSDHGGLLRQLMMGWKGRGFGEEDYFIGKILALCFVQNISYGGTIDLAILVAITQCLPSIEVFLHIDEELYKHLKYIQTNDPTYLELTMTVPKKINGVVKEYPLIEGGEKIPLTKENKLQYLELYPKQYFWAGRRRELEEAKAGFYNVVNPIRVKLFTPFELLQQLRGKQIVDTKTLKAKAHYDNYAADSNVVKWLWEVFDDFPQQYRNKFIQFVTGSPKISVNDRDFSITIEKARNPKRLPVSHTCFNTLELPEYSSKEILSKNLLLAILQGNDCFGII